MSSTLKGMRQLSDSEVALMNEIADHGNQLGELLDKLLDETFIDERWLNIGRTHLQTGIMCIKRAVGRPDNF